MRAISLDALKTRYASGDVASIFVKADTGAFVVEVAMVGGGRARLSIAGDADGRFSDTSAALELLHGIGITTAHVDSDASKTHRTDDEGYAAWLAAEIEASQKDERPSLSHDKVMADMEAEIARAARFSRRA